MKTVEPVSVSGPVDLHSLPRCEETLKRFLHYSVLMDIGDLPLSTRLEIISHFEQLKMLLDKIRIKHELFKQKFTEDKQTIYKKTKWGERS